MRKLKRNIIIYSLSLLAICAAVLQAADTPKSAPYVGDVVCRMCHYAIFKSWENTGHAKAFDILTPDEQMRGECQPCHATARNLKAVQCEACHGAGADYYPMPVMRDSAKALAAGLKPITTATCERCHSRRASHKLKSYNFSELNLLNSSHTSSPVSSKNAENGK